MERPYWRNEEILAEVQELELPQVVDFGLGTLIHATGASTTLLCLAHGNINDTTVRELCYCIIIITLRIVLSLMLCVYTCSRWIGFDQVW